MVVVVLVVPVMIPVAIAIPVAVPVPVVVMLKPAAISCPVAGIELLSVVVRSNPSGPEYGGLVQ